MRIEIKTKTPIKDKDIRALYMMNEALKQSSERMRIENLRFIADKYGFKIDPKENLPMSMRIR